ncbi:MAG TPA: DNA translocase FtsK [Bacillota bacterium]|jgi:hypothetical protein|nr:DNA translocase FtsK [Bacillota bacterium]
MTKRQQRDLLGIIFLAFGLLLAFALLAPSSWTGWLGRFLNTIVKGFFGSLSFLLPAFLLLFSLLFFRERELSVTTRQIGASVSLYVIATAFISMFSLPYKMLLPMLEPLGENGIVGFRVIGKLWEIGLHPELISEGNKMSGGLLGGIFAHSLERIAGTTGAVIILLAVIVSILIYAFGLSPARLAERATSSSDLSADEDPFADRDDADMDAQVKSPFAGSFFAKLFRRGEWYSDDHDIYDVFDDLDTKIDGDGYRRGIPLPEPSRGPFGWDSFERVSSDDVDVTYTSTESGFRKPPRGYHPDYARGRQREPLQGKPYLFDMPPHASSHHADDHTAGTGVRPASVTWPPASDFTIRRKEESIQEESIIDRERWQDRNEGQTGIKRRPERVRKQLSIMDTYKPPPIKLLKEDRGMKKSQQEIREIRELGRKLEETLSSFGVEANIANYTTGPTITRFELVPGPGVKVSRVVSLADDIALSLAAMGVRIEAPIPGKSAIGIEIPNRNTSPVLLRSIIQSDEFKQATGPLVAALGRDVGGDIILCDLAKMPHILIAGATGSGKSVCINSILISLLYRSSPEDFRLLMIDPKIVELNVYNGIPHLMHPVVTDPEKAYGVLNFAAREMDKRYRMFADRKVRDIDSYNEAVRKINDPDEDEMPLPRIVIVIDELADLMAVTQHQVEDAISRLMAKARAVGIHVIIATQRPSVDVITGVIKANIPSRIAFAVASQVDSRTIIDSGGAEKLLGRGDMLYFPIGSIKAIRGQGAFVSNSEVEAVLTYIKDYHDPQYDEGVAAALEDPNGALNDDQGDFGGEDELLIDALTTVIEADYAAVSLLQRRLSVGYPRAARLIDRLCELGWVGPHEGSKPRKILITREQYEHIMREVDGAGGDAHDFR